MSKLKLITGQKGSGKTLWTVDELFKEFERNFDRNYFSDITKLAHTGVKTAPENWTTIPDNSLIIYDEVQFKLLFSRHNSKRDTQILELTTMRKRGIEMWIITQRARFLNADVLGLVDEHVHIERNGKKTSKVYIFQEAELNITKTKKLFAFDKYVYAHNPEIFAFYESIKEGAKHGDRSYLNKGVISTCITLALVLIFGGYFVYKSYVKDGIKIQDSNEVAQKKEQAKSPVPNALPMADQTKANESDLSNVCRQGANVAKPECVKWYNDLSNNKSSVDPTGAVVQTVSYNPNKPYEFNPEPQIQVKDYPRVTGCAKNLKGKYVAIDQQGNLMSGVSEKDCQKWLNGERPFDYTKQPVQAQPMQAQQQQIQAPEVQRKWTPEELEKLMIAKEQGLI